MILFSLPAAPRVDDLAQQTRQPIESEADNTEEGLSLKSKTNNRRFRVLLPPRKSGGCDGTARIRRKPKSFSDLIRSSTFPESQSHAPLHP